MASSELRDSLKGASRDFRNKFLEKIAEEIYSAASSSKDGKVSWGFSSKILKESREQEPWVTKNMISFAYKKFKRKKLLEDVESSTDNNPNSCVEKPVTRNGGRPKGSTLLNKHHQIQTMIAVKNEITTLYIEEKARCREKSEMISNRWLQKRVERVSKLRGLDVKIPLSTIRNCKQQIFLIERGCRSLMSSVEPHLVTLICTMAQIRRWGRKW